MSTVAPLKSKFMTTRQVIEKVLEDFPEQDSICIMVVKDKRVQTFYCCDAAEMALMGVTATVKATEMLRGTD